jgi:hypothetical protein
MWKQVASGQFVLDAAYKTLGSVKDVIFDSIKEAADYEKAVATLNATFLASGRNMPGMTDNLKRYGDELMAIGIADEVDILKSETLLMRMTNLNEKGIKEGARLAAGLASVYGMDVAGATEIVGKGLSGVYRGFTTLAPQVVTAKTDAEKHAAMMKFLNDTYTAAIAQTGTYSGQVKKLGLEWGDTKKALGEAILNSGILQTSMEGVTSALKALTSWTKGEHKQAVLDQTLANEAAHVTLLKMGKQLGWTSSEIKNMSSNLRLSYPALVEWIKGNMLGTEAAKALASVTAARDKALEKEKKAYNETGTAIADKTKEERKLTDTEKDAIKILDNLTKSQNKVTEGRREILRDQATLTAAWKSGAIDTAAYTAGMNDLEARLRELGVVTMGVTVPDAARRMWKVMQEARDKMIDAPGPVKKAWSDAAHDMAAKWDDSMKKIVSTVQGPLNQLSSIFSQANSNRMLEIDNEYNKRKKAILATVTDEVTKAAMLTNLDKEFETKRASAQRTYARQAKAIALADAVINTASAVTAGLRTVPFFPLGIAMGVLAAALGAAQIALIARQPLPLAKGAVFTQPTRMMTDKGGYYEVGEAGTEAILPVAQIPAIARQMGGRAGGGEGRPIILHNHFHFNGREIKHEIIRIVEDAAGIHKLNLRGAIA